MESIWGGMVGVESIIYAAIGSVINQISGVVASVFNYFAGIIGDIVKWVAWISGKIGGFFEGIPDAIWSMVAGVASTIIDALALVVSLNLSDVIGFVKNTAGILTAAITKVVQYATILKDKFQKILDAIHFKTIMQIHKILSLLVPQYREMMRKLYAKIAGISEAVGLGTHFITLALRNVRNVVLDVTTIFGGHYDLGEVEWLNSLGGFFKQVEGKLEKWTNNPEALFYDLAEYIEKPALDGKGSFLGSVWLTIESITGIVEKKGEEIAQLAVDFQKLILDLPQIVKDNLPEGFLETLGDVRDAIDDVIMPKLTAIDKLIGQYAEEIRKIRGDISSAMASILSPKDAILALDKLSQSDQLLVGNVMVKMHWSGLQLPAGALLSAVSPSYDEMIDEAFRIIPESKPPEFLMLEIDQPGFKGFTPSTGAPSPFVGDY